MAAKGLKSAMLKKPCCPTGLQPSDRAGFQDQTREVQNKVFLTAKHGFRDNKPNESKTESMMMKVDDAQPQSDL